jgi:hypothetical protein
MLASNHHTVKGINNSLNINSTSEVNSKRNNKEVQQHQQPEINSSNESGDEDEHQSDENLSDDLQKNNFDRKKLNNSVSSVNNKDKILNKNNIFKNKVDSSKKKQEIINDDNLKFKADFAKSYSFKTPKKDFILEHTYYLTL